MQAQIIKVQHSDNSVRILTAENSLYSAKLSPQLAALQQGLKPGDKVEFDKASGTISSVQAMNLDSFPVTFMTGRKPVHTPGEGSAASSAAADFALLAVYEKAALCAEAPDFATCYALLNAQAQAAHANALVDLTGECKKSSLTGKILCRLTALAAQANGLKTPVEPGINLQVNTKLQRVNSPNEAMVRYQRVLWICSLLIFIPIILGLGQRGFYPVQAGYAASVIFLVWALWSVVRASSNRAVSYVLRLRQRHHN